MADRLLLGMDIGGSKAVTVLGRGAGDIVAEDRIDGWASGSWERDLETLVAHARQLCATAGVELAQVAALGISAPGPPHRAM